jgi:hypothetical protein
MSRVRDALKAELDGGAGGVAARRRRVVRLRAQAAVTQWANHPGRAADGSLSVGEVRITDVRTVVLEDGQTTALEVYAAGAPDPHIRIVNPPTMVADSTGDIELGGQRFREDPMAAVAAVVVRVTGTRQAPAFGRRK